MHFQGVFEGVNEAYSTKSGRRSFLSCFCFCLFASKTAAPLFIFCGVRVSKCAPCKPIHPQLPQDPAMMIAVERPESFFASNPPHQRRHAFRTRPFQPRPRLRPCSAVLPGQANARRPPPPAFSPRAVLQNLKSLRTKLSSRPRPAWALPAPQTQTKHEATDPHEDDGTENENEMEALLAFAEGLDVDGLEDDMEVVPKSSSSSPLPPLPSPPTPPPQAPLRLCPAAGMPYQNPFSEEFASRNEALMPCSPVLQALASVSQPSPPPSPAASCAGPIHSARSAAALMEHRALAVTAVAADGRGQKGKDRREPLSALRPCDPSSSPLRRRRRGGGNGGAAAEQDQKEEATSAGLTVEGEGRGGGRPLEMPRVVVIDEEGGMRRQRRFAQLPYWHENPAL